MKKIIIFYTLLILSFLISNPCYAIKIGLQTGVDRIGVGSSNATSLIDANSNKTICKQRNCLILYIFLMILGF